MRAFCVVVAPPALNDDPGLLERVEDFSIQQFVAYSGVEAFKEYIFGVLFLKRCSDLFDQQRETLAENLRKRGLDGARLAEALDSRDQYTFFVPPDARWNTVRHLKDDVGNRLNRALGELERHNKDLLEDVLEHINFNRKIGQRTLSDDTLVGFIQVFESIPLRDENFEFPDLLGAAYEYLIKYFADSAIRPGRKRASSTPLRMSSARWSRLSIPNRA